MKLNELKEIQEYFEQSLYEMTTFNAKRTGLSSGTGLWVRTEPKGLSHTKYRVKFDHPQHGSAVFALWGDEPVQVAGDWVVSGKDLKKIKTLINLTHNHLRNHIDGIEDSGDLSDALQKYKTQVEEA